jgi:hypothetical protein
VHQSWEIIQKGTSLKNSRLLLAAGILLALAMSLMLAAVRKCNRLKPAFFLHGTSRQIFVLFCFLSPCVTLSLLILILRANLLVDRG